tara:strand:- start:315 stop:461 length:147 start_codon:yes stop_codon:yes gene_type:complete
MTVGQPEKWSVVIAIEPPNQYSNAVRQELANQRKLKHDGGGLYSLAAS